MELRLNGADVRTIGPLGAWGDLSWITRYGESPCGMYEVSWTMPLPPDFEHPLLRRGTRVELMDGPWRIGSSLILTEPARGTGFSDPWQFVAQGVGREVVGENSWYAVDGSWAPTTTASTAIDRALGNGLAWEGYAANVTAATPTVVPENELVTIGALMSMIGDRDGTRWGVGQDDYAKFISDPTTPTYHVVPGAAALGVADDNYATFVIVNYVDSTSHAHARVTAPATTSAVETRYGRREYVVDLTDRGEISAASAQSRADGILALTKGRLGWVNGLTLTSQKLLTSGGVPANLAQVSEQVGDGIMVRLHGIFDDLLETNGHTWLDIIIGEAKYADGSDMIDLNPLGMVATDFAAVIEDVAGRAA